MFVIGTAGHVDHGKSTLVRALTGIDPDRLAEEKAREMTIDLGFAWLKLPGGREVGVIDVPGHEHFIKNMLAGVSGMDLALLVVAANESIKQQTREHLAILDLMEVPQAIMVITQSDLADADQITLVGMEIEDLIRPTRFAGAPVVAVSSVTGQGLEDLKTTIDRVLNTAQPRRDIGKPRLPIDRVFTISGSGTVVTGTLVDGTLTLGQEVEILPPALKSRIRGLQTHKTQLNAVGPGNRVAVNLVGLSSSDLKRGQVLTRPGWLTSTSMLDARLRLLTQPDRPLRHNTEVSLHTGSAEVMARVRLLEKEEARPGEITWVQFILWRTAGRRQWRPLCHPFSDGYAGRRHRGRSPSQAATPPLQPGDPRKPEDPGRRKDRRDSAGGPESQTTSGADRLPIPELIWNQKSPGPPSNRSFSKAR